MKDILFLSFPHQLLHAISALKYERSKSEQPFNGPVIVLVWAYRAVEHLPGSRFRHLFNKLLLGLPWVKLIFPGYLTRQFSLSPHRSIFQRVRCLNRQFHEKDVRLIGYAHDISLDHTAQVVLQAFPLAKALCFGDTPGFLYSRAEIESSIVFRPSFIKSLFRNQANTDSGIRWRFADENIVAIHFDSKTPPDEACTKVLPPEMLKLTLQTMCEGLETERREQKLFLQQLGTATSPRLLLISNFSESNLTTRRSELNMYRELINRHALARDVIVIKPHAGSPSNMVRRIAASLPRLRIVQLPKSLQFIPIEMLDVILRGSHTLSVSSSTALISLLYGPEHSIHALTDEVIERYFAPGSRAAFQAANKMIVDAINSNSQTCL